MVCRYGDKAAREEEAACTEEGVARSPIATTAWAGAMMAVWPDEPLFIAGLNCPVFNGTRVQLLKPSFLPSPLDE